MTRDVRTSIIPRVLHICKITLEAFKVRCFVEQLNNSYSEAFNEERKNKKTNIFVNLVAILKT